MNGAGPTRRRFIGELIGQPLKGAAIVDATVTGNARELKAAGFDGWVSYEAGGSRVRCYSDASKN